MGDCTSGGTIVFYVIAKRIVNIIQLVAPILAIIALTILVLKIVMNPEDKKYKNKIKNKIIALLMVFFIPLLLKVALNLVGNSSVIINCFEKEELKAYEENIFNNVEYIEINEDSKTQNILPDPDKYEKGKKKKQNNSTSNNKTNNISPTRGNAVYFFNAAVSSDAFLIQDAGRFGLIDTSVSSRGNYLVKQLRKLGVQHLDFIILTHMHGDHIGGYDKIMNNFSVGTLYVKADGAKYPSHQSSYKSVIKKAMKKGTAICDVKKANCQSFRLGNISFQLYNTDFFIPGGISSRDRVRFENSNSIVAVSTTNGIKTYYAGDIGNYFGNNRESIVARQVGDIDVYKVAHHGYVSFNNHQDALNKLKPEFAVVTNGPVTASTAISRVKKSNSKFKKAFYTYNGTVVMTIGTNGNINFTQ